MNKKEKTQVDIGLDIGIASVGWAITNAKTYEIIEHGVRRFPTVDDPKGNLKSKKRREARSARRQVNRRKTLRRDFVKFLIDSKYIDNLQVDKKGAFVQEFLNKYINNKDLQKKWNKENKEIPYSFVFREKGLNKKLSKNELITILYWYINHRGLKYEVIEEKSSSDNKKKEAIKLKKDIIKNEKSLPIKIQINHFKKYKYLNGTFNRSIKLSKYVEEIETIFKHQDLTTKFKEEFIKLIKHQRSFEEGPGNEKSKTRYGRFYKLENNQLIKRDTPAKTMWEDTVGMCTFYPNEFRAAKRSFTSEIFNLLTELNNVTIKSTGLNYEDKMAVLKLAVEGATSYKMLKEIKKRYGIDKKNETEIQGLSDNKLTEITSIKKLLNILPLELIAFDKLIKNDRVIKNNLIDQMYDIFNQTKIIEKRCERLSEIEELKHKKDLLKIISETHFEKVSMTHNFSYKAMQDMIFNFINKTSYNQSKYIKEKGIDLHKGKEYGKRYLKEGWVEDIIASPTVKRSLRQCIKVLNAIFRLTYERNLEIKDIIIEMARESNNKQVKDNEKNRQNYLKENNKKIEKIINKISEGNGNYSIKKSNWIKKVRLLDQQKRCDAYTGETITFDDLLKNPTDYEIDHIIPRSQSHSNGDFNIVLTKAKINQKKGNRTPYQFLGSNSAQWNKLVEMWEKWYKNNPKEKKFYNDANKFKYLTSRIDFSKPENQLGFIARNLVDTRYTTRELLEALNQFKKSNNKNFKIKAINGKMTFFARREISKKYDKKDNKFVLVEELKRPKGLPLFDNKTKSRIWHGHHAEDAYILTILNSEYRNFKSIEIILKASNKKFNELEENKKSQKYKLTNINYKKLKDLFDKARDELNKKMGNLHFSRMIEKPRNTKLFNETLYKGKINEKGSIDKYSYLDLLEKKSNKKFKASDYFGEDAKHKEKLVIYKKDRLLYDVLNSIYLNYLEKNKNNPFLVAANEVMEDAKYLEVTYKNSKRNVTKKIKRLNYLSQEEKDPLKIIKANNNGNSFYESLEWLCINMYKDKNGKYKIIPVNALNHKFHVEKNGEVDWKIKKNVLESQFKEKNIVNKIPIATFFKGDLIEPPNDEEMVYVNGLEESASKLEVKFLSRQNKKRDFRTINTLLMGSKLCKTDILGISKKIKFQF